MTRGGSKSSDPAITQVFDENVSPRLAATLVDDYPGKSTSGPRLQGIIGSTGTTAAAER